MKNVMLKILLLFFIGVFVISLLNILDYYNEKSAAQKQFEELQGKIARSSENVGTAEKRSEIKNEIADMVENSLKK